MRTRKYQYKRRFALGMKAFAVTRRTESTYTTQRGRCVLCPCFKVASRTGRNTNRRQQRVDIRCASIIHTTSLLPRSFCFLACRCCCCLSQSIKQCESTKAHHDNSHDRQHKCAASVNVHSKKEARRKRPDWDRRRKTQDVRKLKVSVVTVNWELGAVSCELGAGSRELGAGSWELRD